MKLPSLAGVRPLGAFGLSFGWGLVLMAGLGADVFFVVLLRLFDLSHPPEANDFGAFWTAGRLALHGHAAAAYDWQTHWAAEQAAYGYAVSHHAWLYPPLFLLLMAPLALLPLAISRLVWLGLTLAGYLATIRPVAMHRAWLPFALAYGGVALTIGFSSNGFLSTALLGGGLMLLERRPILAGALIGALAYKPQLGLLLPVALVAGRYWRATLAAVATVLALAGLTVLLFGADAWLAFRDSLTHTQGGILEGEQGFNMITVYAAVRRLGGAAPLPAVAQAVAALSSAAIVVWAWRRPAPLRLKSALLVALIPLATPFAYNYDLMILALPIGQLLAEAVRSRLDWREQPVLLCAFAFPLVSLLWIPTSVLGPLIPIGLAALLVLRLHRHRAATRRRLGAVTGEAAADDPDQ
jgi:alpha-1,2-mannosyltransferase